MIAARWAWWWSAPAVVLALDVPGPEPRVGVATAIGVSLATGGLVFVVLAGARVRPLLPPRGRRPAAARLAMHFAGRAAVEEAVWRGLVLGSLSAAVGPAAGLGLSTCGFAASHVAAQGRLAAGHLLTGAAFGAVYLATGQLLAAVLAHATYDTFVTLAVVSENPCPFGPIVGHRPALYDRATGRLP